MTDLLSCFLILKTLQSRSESIPFALQKEQSESVTHRTLFGSYLNLVHVKRRPIPPTMHRGERKMSGWKLSLFSLPLSLSLFKKKERFPPHRFVRGINMTMCANCSINAKFLLLISPLCVLHVLFPCLECPSSISVKTLLIL